MSYVTLNYPFEPVEAPPEYRGKPRINPKLCIGCGACARVCPPDAITIEDDYKEYTRRIKLDVSKCIRCARCEEVCPTEAMKLTREFELATPSKDDLIQVLELKLAKCSICGRALDLTLREIEKAKQMILHLPRDEVEEIVKNMTLCRDCRRKNTIQTVFESTPKFKLREGQ